MRSFRLTTTRPVALGATMAQQDLRPIVEELRAVRSMATTIVLDFAGIEMTNGSYLRGTLLWLQAAGIAAAELEEGARRPPEGIEPLNVFPVATNLSADVSEELDIALRAERLPYLVGRVSEVDRIVDLVRVGHLDPALDATLTALAAEKRATAGDLCSRYPQKPEIKPPAWSNRLSELYRLRLARREREGRQWIYTALSEEDVRG